MTNDSAQRSTGRHDAGPDRAEVVIRPPVLWALLVLAGLGLDALMPLAFMPAGLASGWIGVAVWLGGFALAAIAIGQFRRAGTDVQTSTPTSAIVDDGVYAWSRNPIYVGAHVGLAGVAIGFDTLWVVAALVPFYLIIRHGVVAPEETYLERKFGEPYLAYKRRVRRWL
jgi:protein-S-isoprenylcysteine O-methyltransferase Ste14